MQANLQEILASEVITGFFVTVVFNCSRIICLNGGSCIEGGVSGNATCECPMRFTGERCDVDLAISLCFDICFNGGFCVDVRDLACTCPIGFTGQRCETISSLCDNLCLNDGTCIEEVGNTTCLCTVGFTGERCEISLCSQLSCANGGICVSLIGEGAVCACLPGFAGVECDISDGNYNEIYHNYCYRDNKVIANLSSKLYNQLLEAQINLHTKSCRSGLINHQGSFFNSLATFCESYIYT